MKIKYNFLIFYSILINLHVNITNSSEIGANTNLESFPRFPSNILNFEEKKENIDNSNNSLIFTSKKCNSKICDETGGKCINDQICVCYENYTTLQLNDNHKLCNYPKKNRISTAFIELFMGFGIGHFYSERKVNGFLKMLFFMFLCCIACCSIAIGVKFEQEQQNIENSVVKFFYFVYSCTLNLILTWQIYDFLMFICNVYKDGNNIPFT